MLKAWILLVGISCLITTISLAQDLDYQYQYAQEQYSNGNTKIALREYLRTYYFDRNSEYTNLPKEIAECFIATYDYGHSVEFYDHYLNQSSVNESDRFNAQLRKAQVLLLNEDPNAALIQLLSTTAPANNKGSDRLQFLLAFTNLVNGDLENGFDAIQSLSYIHQNHHDDLKVFRNKLEKNLNTKHNIPRLMSAVIPGTGQIVNGEYADAANSMVLTGGLLFLLFDVAKELTLIDALVSVGPFYFRYYLGGINNAHSGSIKKEKRKKSILLNELLVFTKKCKEESSIE